MRMLFLMVLLVLWAGPAGAISDQTPDLLGLYFDEGADLFCQEWVAPYSILFMYAVYSNPSVPEILGFDFAMEYPANIIVLNAAALCNPVWDPVEGYPFVIGCAEPQAVGPANVLVQFVFLPITTEPTFFYIEGSPYAPEPGLSPAVWLPDGQYLPLQVRGGEGNPTAMFNTQCTVDTEPLDWDTLKLLYR